METPRGPAFHRGLVDGGAPVSPRRFASSLPAIALVLLGIAACGGGQSESNGSGGAGQSGAGGSIAVDEADIVCPAACDVAGSCIQGFSVEKCVPACKAHWRGESFLNPMMAKALFKSVAAHGPDPSCELNIGLAYGVSSALLPKAPSPFHDCMAVAKSSGCKVSDTNDSGEGATACFNAFYCSSDTDRKDLTATCFGQQCNLMMSCLMQNSPATNKDWWGQPPDLGK